jgi:hypothetical protein
MTFVHIDIQQTTHTCPAYNEPHPIDVRRAIVVVVPGGPCQRPVTVRLDTTSVVVACGRRLPTDRQCPACKITVIERNISTTHLGHHDRHRPQRPTTSGIAA